MVQGALMVWMVPVRRGGVRRMVDRWREVYQCLPEYVGQVREYRQPGWPIETVMVGPVVIGPAPIDDQALWPNGMWVDRAVVERLVNMQKDGGRNGDGWEDAIYPYG